MNKRHLADDILRVGVHLTKDCLHIARIDDIDKALILVTTCVRHNESYIYAVTSQATRHSVAGST